MRRPVLTAADAAAYANEYARALRVAGVRAARVLGFGKVYWVYVSEQGTGRSAFSLEVRGDGGIALKQFPAMDPEMMWNQKYGHRARPDPAAIEERLAPVEAEERVRRALPNEAGMRAGKGSAYYGYVLFPLCEAGRSVGEAAVNTASGDVVWRRFPEPPQEAWAESGESGNLCD